MLSAVFAERELEARGKNAIESRPVLARIGQPEPDPEPGGDWRCPLQIVGIGDEEIFYANGVDSVQALQLGFLIMGIRLEDLCADGLELSWLGDSDLGFPLVME